MYSCQQLLRNNDWPESIPGGKAYDVALICSWLEEFMDQTVSWLSTFVPQGALESPHVLRIANPKTKQV